MAVACPEKASLVKSVTSAAASLRPATAVANGARAFRWYAVRTKPRHEKMAAMMLDHKGYENFLPLYRPRRALRDRDVRVPLFPGYLFCHFNESLRLPILTTPG